MGKKVNPKRRPMSEADVRKAWSMGADFGMTFCVKGFLYILKNHGASDEDVHQLNGEFEDLLDSYNRGDITQEDIDSVLQEEFKLEVRFR